MKETKYRAWINGGKNMWSVSSIDFQGNEVFLTSDENPLGWVDWRLSEVTLMQSTGMKDRNGVEIYEGDVLFNDLWTVCRTVGCTKCKDDGGYHPRPLVVTWFEDEGRFGTEEPNGYYDMEPKHFKEAVVVGNIFETPEFLKG